MISRNYPFSPKYSEAIIDSLTDTVSVTAIDMSRCSQLIISNTGNKVAYVKTGISSSITITDLTDCIPIMPVSSIILTVGEYVTHIAGICASTETTTIHAIPGNGV